MQKLVVALCLAGIWSQVVAVIGAEPLLRPGDRVALVGGTFVERMQSSGTFEAELQSRRPEWKLSLRNLGWSGDNVFNIARKGFDTPADGVKRLLADLDSAQPTVLVLAYGFSEASAGEVTSGEFERGYRQLIQTLSEKPYRLVLVSPLPMPGYRSPNYAETIAQCQAIVSQIASELQVPLIDADWSPTDDSLEASRLVPSPTGYVELASSYASSLVGGTNGHPISPELIAAIVAKDELFFHRHRPQNETYLFLFRKHEQGRNAAEIPQFDPLIQAADEAIWAAAKH